MTLVQSARIEFGALSVACVVALYPGCSSSDVTTNRQGGGPTPPVPEAGTDSGTEASPEASPPDALVPWCAAYHIVNCVCQQCHQNPPVHGAPISLMTYDDTQAPYSNTLTVAQEMAIVVASRAMPFLDDKTVMPPVLPLFDDDYSTLLAWLGQGATDLGGQDCPMTCDWSKGPPPGR